MKERCLEPELLDQLPAADPRAVRSRRDLRAVNAWMGNARIVAKLLQSIPFAARPRTVADLGAGDGTFMLAVAQRLQPAWQDVTLWLVDQQHLLTADTHARYREVGWTVHAIQAEALSWLGSAPTLDLVVMNLFLHHFDERRLQQLLQAVSSKTHGVVACEPRRFTFAGLAGRLVFLIGSNSVTRHDAVASVRAGFRGQEISPLWPRSHWQTQEGEAGPFSHYFWARRTGP